jgi:glyoxylase-like metal-dependent hydrolase (beta-lactamase superfamily II)
MAIIVKHLFDKDTFSFTYLIFDTHSKEAAVIDPVMNYESNSATISYSSARELLSLIEQLDLNLKWILETHVHADHMSAAQWLKKRTAALVIIGEQVTKVQDTFNQLYDLDKHDLASNKDFDRLLKDGDEIKLGEHSIKSIHTPGHTPSCCTYLIDDMAFVGDTLFMPDFGTARCDFPGGDATQLYHSIQRILSLPEDTTLYMCHDYMPNGRELMWQTTVLEQKQNNIHINQKVTQEDYIKMRTERDKELSAPKLILPALQVNIKAGKLPENKNRKNCFLKIPLSFSG